MQNIVALLQNGFPGFDKLLGVYLLGNRHFTLAHQVVELLVGHAGVKVGVGFSG